MQAAEYDKSSVESIFEHAKKLTGKSLAEACFVPAEIANSRNRGDLGSLVEAFYFEHRPPSNHGPDFPEAGLELKTTGVVKTSAGTFKAKERLVLTMIDFEKLVTETWEASSFLQKCRLMLILFYLYEASRPVVDRRFVLEPLLYKITEHDIEIIKQDWEFIRNKVAEGKAHELSEGDTFYLGACRKGAGGDKEPLRKQPNSGIGAKARAFSFKPKYVNALIEGLDAQPALLKEPEQSFDEAVAEKFRKFVGMTSREIGENFELLKASKNQKGFHRQLAVKILSDGGHSVPEIDKAGIEMKTIRLKKSGKPRESMSFPGFKFMEILHEEWEESSFFEKIEQKFLLVIFQEDLTGQERLVGAYLWNMPFEDRQEAMKVWEETKRRVAIDATNLPKISESHVAHVRPKGQDSNDKIPTPQGGMHTKQCFWLNATYIDAVVSQLLRNSV
jgi:DNA mismatch repair protein MutH